MFIFQEDSSVVTFFLQSICSFEFYKCIFYLTFNILSFVLFGVHARMDDFSCRKTEAALDKCVFDNLSVERPHLGFFSMPRIHKTDRPMPVDPIVARTFQKPPGLDDAPAEVS